MISFLHFSGENIRLAEHINQLEESLADLKRVCQYSIIVSITQLLWQSKLLG
jgi:hypothetical protein